MAPIPWKRGRGGDDGRSSGHDRDSRFVCINNNDNSGAANEPTPEPPDTITCEECFEENLTPVPVQSTK